MADTSTISARLIPNVQYVTPNTGDTVTINGGGYIKLLINPSGTLATLTLNFPVTPQDGDVIEVASSQIVTSLTLAVGTIIGALTSFAVGGFGTFIYSATASKWFRIG